MFAIYLKRVGLTLVGLFFLFIFLIVITGYIGGLEVEYPTNKDTWHVFGNGRFHIGGTPSKRILVLFDLESLPWHAVFNAIDKYVENDPYVYIISYSDNDRPNYGDDGYSMFLPGTGEEVYYDSTDEMPQYLKINYRTGATDLYINFEDVPAEDQAMFNQKVDRWCEFRRTCFEK